MNPYSSAGKVTIYRLKVWSSVLTITLIFIFTSTVRWGLGSGQPPIQWLLKDYSSRYSCWSMKLTTPLYRVLRYRMHGVLSPCPLWGPNSCSSWCACKPILPLSVVHHGMVLMHRDNFLFLLSKGKWGLIDS